MISSGCELQKRRGNRRRISPWCSCWELSLRVIEASMFVTGAFGYRYDAFACRESGVGNGGFAMPFQLDWLNVSGSKLAYGRVSAILEWVIC